ncbi:membrane-spanning 4-domains subfamily A member 4A-like isoform X2 [Mixophyes fleayi]|uniref:membrane-spanning 4-domains subfamily A member 4A-like isoform X2 n=1 Tax=Mixophyes fleayi TaxID=3061075 RepID=UPI003F4DF3F8
MSAAASDVGSVVIISQLQPQRHQSTTSEEGLTSNAAAPLPKPLVAFYRGEPEALGVTQIFVGITVIAFGFALTAAWSLNHYIRDYLIITGVLFWSGIMYIISGSLSVAAATKPTLGKVRSSLVLNIISSVAAGIAILLIGICLPSDYTYDYYQISNVYCAYYKPSEDCEGHYDRKAFFAGIVTLLLILNVLIFTINVSTSVFACRTVCRSSYSDMSLVIYQTTSVPDTTAASTAALSSKGDIKI